MKKLVLILITLLILVGAYSKNTPQVFIKDPTGEIDTDLIDFAINELGFDSTHTFVIRFTSDLSKNVNGIIVPSPTIAGRKLFYIWINEKIKGREINHTIVHEMVHARQYIDMILIEIDEFHYQWKKQVYDVRYIEYLDRPWENDAIYEAQRLVSGFKKLQRKDIDL